MKANRELIAALDALEKEKNISKEVMCEALETALITAYKKNYGPNFVCYATVDRKSGGMKVWAEKTVVEEVEDDSTQMTLEEAREISIRYQIGDVVELPANPATFGRIAAQTAKQMVVQKIREAERGNVFMQFSDKENDILTGKVVKIEKKGIYLDMGNAEALLAPSEQVPGEVLNVGDTVKVYILEVKKSTKALQLLVSRTHPGMVKKFFSQEVPEIADGTVVIKSIAREAGSRTKISVYSDNENVDAVGSCVGPKGARVAAVVDALGGEKVDIILYDEDISKYISAALNPATVSTVTVDEEAKSAFVTVPDFQLSLAIGKEGQNARLAARLTGWKIDIKGDSQVNG
ncbi:MAG: transcription termination/antitermination protein NusA [Clostridia bacterium]|nr:transcription termination/antitermination protein NusA [Clostridia bacterium]